MIGRCNSHLAAMRRSSISQAPIDCRRNTVVVSEQAWTSRGGSKYHLVPNCGGLLDGQQAARDHGRPSYPVVATTIDKAMADGRDPCLHCSPPIADTLTGPWGQFIRGLRGFQPEPTLFEREFAARVLCEVTGLRPDHVHPQYRIIDSTSRLRFIDFAIVDGDRRIAIEIDGTDKVSDQSARTAQLEDLLTRQNDLVNQGWQVLRFTNSQVMHRSAQCARTVAERLQRPPSQQPRARPRTSASPRAELTPGWPRQRSHQHLCISLDASVRGGRPQ